MPLSEEKFVFIGGVRHYITDDEPQIDDMFMYEKEGYQYYGFCDAISSDGTKVIRECSCGMCTMEEKTILRSECKKIVPSPIKWN